VTGSGLRTQTPAFIHEVTDGKLTVCSPSCCYGPIIDHPLCNGRPNAMLIVTGRITVTDIRDFDSGVRYFDPHWYIVAQGEGEFCEGDSDLDEGQQFNVLVINTE